MEALEDRLVLATIGSDLTIVNATPYKFVEVSTTGYSGDQPYEIDWNVADTIKSGGSVTTRQEWENNFWNETDANAKTTYKLAGTPYQFAIFALYANVNGGRQRAYGLEAINLPGDPADGTEILQPTNDNGQNSIVIAGTKNRFTYGNDQSDWMQNSLSTIGDKTLRQISIPGSHDSGMSEVEGGTAGGTSANVQTQTLNIGGQLEYGVRYFDIRPVIAGGVFRAGHYTDLSLFGTAGANGQSIDSMVSQINQFTRKHHELIILNLSHDLNTDSGTKNYPDLDQDQYNRLLKLLSGIHQLYVAPHPDNVDLTKVTMNRFIGGGRSAVVVIAKPSGDGISLGGYAKKGFYTADHFPVYDSYSNTDDFNQMAQDQLGKMAAQRKAGNEFLLSWTLTLSGFNNVNPFGGSILGLAQEANQNLARMLFDGKRVDTSIFPNIIYTDNVGGGLPDTETLPTQSTAVLSAAVNQELYGNTPASHKRKA